MSFGGNLGSLSLPNVLQLIHREGVSGTLHIRGSDTDLRIYFDKGCIVYGAGVGKEEQLLHIMAKKGILSREEQAEAFRYVPDHEFRLGSHLLQRGLIPLDTWRKFTKLTVDQTLQKAFLLEDADFTFQVEPIPVPDVYRVNINLMQLILDITRKIDEWNFIRKHIPDKQIVFYVSDVPDDENRTIRFNRSEWSVLSKVDGKKSVEDIAGESELDELTVYKILYSLVSSGLIKRVENVYLNQRGDFVDYEGILTLYMDLLKIVERNFKQEIGVQFYTFYHKCLAQVSESGLPVLDGFDPFSESTGTGVQRVLKHMAMYPNFKEGKQSLLRALNGLLRALLSQMESVVGTRLTEATVQELVMAVSFVGKYQANSDIKRFVLDGLMKKSEN